LEEFLLALFINLNMTIAMGGNFMPFPMDHLHNLGCSFCHIPKDEEGRLHFELAEKGKDFLDIGQYPILTPVPARRGENMFDIADVEPIFYIHC
jgi:hypothetical protein